MRACERREVGALHDAPELGRRGRAEFFWKSLLRQVRFEWSLRLFLCALLFLAAAACAAIPERWFADKATLTTATREACYATFPARNVVLFTLPEALVPAFETPPQTRKIVAGEAYFIDHCLNHHPEVPDAIYRQIEEILERPEEVIQDRRNGGDALVLTKTFEGTRYVLVIRHHPDKRLLLYKTLFPSKKKVYPRLPRWQPEREAAREQSFP